MRILAIDPGPTESAWVIWDTERGMIDSFGKEENQIVRTHALFRMAECMVVEMIASYGMAVGAEVFETCVWVGRLCEAWDSGGLPTSERIFRRDVKMHLCQSMRAKDGNIRQALIDKLGPPGTKKKPGPTYGISGDVWAALAVAVTYSETRLQSPGLTTSSPAG
jgi:hypothetical protein